MISADLIYIDESMAISQDMDRLTLDHQNIKKSNPGIQFTEVGRVLGEKWKKMSEKEPYEAKARADKKRYKDEISGYKNPQPTNMQVDLDGIENLFNSMIRLDVVGIRDDDLGMNSPLMWLCGENGNRGIQSLDFQGIGVTPWMQPRLDASVLGTSIPSTIPATTKCPQQACWSSGSPNVVAVSASTCFYSKCSRVPGPGSASALSSSATIAAPALIH
ncbi:hypothetical protein F0562_018307 [Nyssa sinensis]|uniref:HMG box domain-containing protein n=1 Tax=Nyssa sinensis TaxID=561372 RepID=A0A5J4ZC73_9ASTE|nr:hypothetical protein F0562_018307 [Nyssa sinensis]